MLACAGLFAEATAAEFRAAPGGDVERDGHGDQPLAGARDAGGDPLPVRARRRRGAPAGRPAPTGGRGAVERSARCASPTDPPPTTPVLAGRAARGGASTTSRMPRSSDGPRASPPPRSAFTSPSPGGRMLTVRARSRSSGPIRSPASATARSRSRPSVSVLPTRRSLMFPGRAREAVTVTLTAGAREGERATLRPEAAGGLGRRAGAAPFTLAAQGERGELTFQRAAAPRRQDAARAAKLRASSPRSAGGAASRAAWCASCTTTSRSRPCCVDAEVRAGSARARDRRHADRLLPRPGRRGAGEPAPRRIRRHAAGRRARWPPAALARFDAIVIGVRAFNTSERLRAAHAALMAYVEGGGTLVVQYNTNNRLAPLHDADRPLAVRHQPAARHRRDGGGHVRDADAPRAHHANQLAGARLRRLGPGARPLLRRELGPALRDAAGDARPGRARRCRGACSGRATARASSSTPGSRSSASCRRACRAPIACSRTCSRDGRAQTHADGLAPPGRRARRAGRRAAVLTWRAIYLHRARRAGRRDRVAALTADRAPTDERARLGGAVRHAGRSSSPTACGRRARASAPRRLPARRLPRPLADGRPVGHGDAGQRDHLPVDARPGLRGRHALRAVLLRPAAGDGGAVGRVRAALLPAARPHRLRVPGEALRSARRAS